ncbi:MAG: hypothetical protein FWE16_02075 [Firmicutes bacterium]|nr:hypothetical protein [Bacillota bacterium]
MKKDDILHKLKDDKFHSLNVYYVTPYGELRTGLDVPVSEAAGILDSGFTIDPAGIDRTIKGGTMADVTILPDIKSFREIPSMDHDGLRVAHIFGDIFGNNGKAHPLCPRGTLKKSLADILMADEKFIVGLENEYYVRTNGELTGENGYGLESPDDPLTRLRRLTMHDIISAGIDVTKSHKECGKSQYEYVLKHADALTAADNYLLADAISRYRAGLHGYSIDRSPFMGSDNPVNSDHINMSIENGVNSFLEGDGISHAAKFFGEGVLDNNAIITALTNTTANSYAALEKLGKFTGMGDSRMEIIRSKKGVLEYRTSDRSMCPHNTLAAILGAGRSSAVVAGGKYRNAPKNFDGSIKTLESALADGITLGLPNELFEFHINNRKNGIGRDK